MKIIFSQHANNRLRTRNFTKELILNIVVNPDIIFFDTAQKSNVAVAKRLYNLKERIISVFYHFHESYIVLHTFHIESEQEITNRVLKGRYIKL